MVPFHQFAIVFIALFVITNPLGNLGVFVSITHGDTEAFKKQQAMKASIYSFLLLFVFFVAGKYILEFFGITIDVIQIGGGYYHLEDWVQFDGGKKGKRDFREGACRSGENE